MNQDFIIEKGVLKKYTGEESNVIIPEGVKSIGESAFSDCSSLTSVTIPKSVTSIGDYAFIRCENIKSINVPDGVKSIGDGAFNWCKKLKNINIPDSVTSVGISVLYGTRWMEEQPQGLIIAGKVVIDYTGKQQKTIIIPEGIKAIAPCTFSGCKTLKSITIPESMESIGAEAFRDCVSLDNIDSLEYSFKFGKAPFGEQFRGGIPAGLQGECFRLIPHLTDGSLKEYILETDLWESLTLEQQIEVFLSRQSQTLSSAYLKCIKNKLLKPLGNALEARLSQKPSAKECSATALYMTGFKDKVPVETLQKLYSLLRSAKAASKALAIIDNDLALKEKLGQGLLVAEGLAPAERLVMEKLIAEKRSQKDLENCIKEYYGLLYSDLPAVLDKNGKETEPYVLAWLLLANEVYESVSLSMPMQSLRYVKAGICPEAKGVLEEIDEDSLQNALLELSKKYLAKYVNTKKKYLCYPICRYANEAVMTELTKEAPKWRTSVSGNDAPPLIQFRIGCMFNDTRAAMLFAERYHDLDKYAKLRGIDADTLRNTVLSEFGLDETGKKQYDLGNTILEVELQDDLTLSLYDQGAQKIVKSVPKKNADPEKYEKAKADLADMRKNIKKVAKARNNALFEDFLTGKEYESGNWNKIHFSNPLLNRIARLLVWMQGNSTFTLSPEGAIDSAGQEYTITGKPIRLAHPMEMSKTEVEAWQKYFTSYKLRQPFAQIWEPVIDPKSVGEDRYSGIVLPLFTFNGRDKHGIIGTGFRAYSDFFDVTFKDCELELDPSTGRLDSWGYDEYTYTLGKFSFKKYTRYTNHIVGILDGMTVKQKILKDDVSVVNRLDSFTLAQITDFINQASEHNCSNVTAALLEYKNTHFAGLNPMEQFWLEDF